MVASDDVPFATLVQFSGAEMRLQWLADELTRQEPAAVVQDMERVLRASEAGHPRAREVTAAFVLFVVSDPDAPLIATLRLEAAEADLLHVQRFLERGPRPPSQARPFKELPVPDYGRGRELTLGERRSLARRPSRRDFERLLKDPHPMVISLILANPRTVEDDIVRLATLRPARVELLAEVAKSPRWMERARVRNCFLHNPGTPSELAVPLLYLCARNELVDIVGATYVQPLVRRCARELCDQRAPLPSRVQSFDELQ